MPDGTAVPSPAPPSAPRPPSHAPAEQGERRCATPGCQRPRHARGLCKPCYSADWRARHPDYQWARAPMSKAEGDWICRMVLDLVRAIVTDPTVHASVPPEPVHISPTYRLYERLIEDPGPAFITVRPLGDAA